MKAMLQVRQNIFYTKEKSDSVEYKKVHEIVLLLDSPCYEKTNEGNVIRKRGVEEVRFACSTKGLETLIEILNKYKGVNEEDLE